MNKYLRPFSRRKRSAASPNHPKTRDFPAREKPGIRFRALGFFGIGALRQRSADANKSSERPGFRSFS